MADIQDLGLSHHDAPSEPTEPSSDYSFRDTFGGLSTDEVTDSSSRAMWVVPMLLLIAAGAGGYYYMSTRTSPAAPQTAVAQAPPAVTAPVQPKEGPLVEAEKIDLPPLPEMDGVVRNLLMKLSSHPKVLAWLATKQLIENFTL